MVSTFWTDERVKILRDEWPQSCAVEIADMLGGNCTKNMVIGKANRLGLMRKDAGQISRLFWLSLSDEERRKRAYQLALAMELSWAKRRAQLAA